MSSDRPTLLLVTADLFLGSRLKGFAEQAGYRVASAANLDRVGEITSDSPRRVVVDLATPGLDVGNLVVTFGPNAAERVAAYAPHVRIDLLKAARAAGLRAVFTRGQLETELRKWLT